MYRSKKVDQLTPPQLDLSRFVPSPPSVLSCLAGLASAQEKHGVKVGDKSWLFFTPGTVQSMNAACAMLPDDASVMVMTPRWAGEGVALSWAPRAI